MIDLLDYVLPPDSFKASSHMESGDGTKYNATLFQPGWWYNIKSAKGYPWDINHFDDQLIYQNVTEGPQGWTDPTSYKAFASKTWPNGHGGIAWMPRVIDSAQGASDPLITADTTYNTYQKGLIITKQNLGGPAVCFVRGPVQMDVGNLIGADCVVQTYLWGANLVNQEVNTYVRGVGLVRWQLWNLVNGIWFLMAESLMDTQKPGGTPALNFPNLLP